MELDKIIHGDCLTVMKEIPNESLDLICIDPPYHLSSKGHGTVKMEKDKNSKYIKCSFCGKEGETYITIIYPRLSRNQSMQIVMNLCVDCKNLPEGSLGEFCDLEEFQNIKYFRIKNSEWELVARLNS